MVGRIPSPMVTNTSVMIRNVNQYSFSNCILNSCSSMHAKSKNCIVLFDLLLQQLYGILGQPSYHPNLREYSEDLEINEPRVEKTGLRGF